MKKLTFLIVLLSNTALAEDVETYIKQGIALHDKGKYELAAKKYQQALELEPDNALAQYELSYTYMASQQNQSCIKAAEKGIKLKSDLYMKFIVVLGSCYSQAGKLKQAITTFRSGIKEQPENARLHLNMAVTLVKQRKEKEAITHLKEAIKYANGYASPYFYIAELYHNNNYDVPAIFFYMKFVLMEPNSQRSKISATRIFKILNQGVEMKENGDINLFVDSEAPKDEGDFTGLEMMLPMALAAEAGKKSPKVVQQTNALASFVQICLETEDEKLAKSFTWQHATKSVFALQKSGHFKTYAYLLAEKSGSKEAGQWLDSNPKKIDELANAIKSL